MKRIIWQYIRDLCLLNHSFSEIQISISFDICLHLEDSIVAAAEAGLEGGRVPCPRQSGGKPALTLGILVSRYIDLDR